MILSAKELQELTRRERPGAQSRVLRHLGIAFHVHPDGALIVGREVVATKLGGQLTSETKLSMQYEVDVRGIENHGKTTPKP